MNNFKIGDKVETPFGVGVIHNIDRYQYEDKMYWISFNGMPEISFDEQYIKPYKTAHEKLIELGWELKIEYPNQKYIYYQAPKTVENWDEIRIMIDKETKKVCVDFQYEGGADINLELSKILTQYLEELEK